MKVKRVFLIGLDSFGIGNAPDAEEFGDRGSNTLATISRSEKFDTPNLRKLGLFRIEGVKDPGCGDGDEAVTGAYGRLTERSRGKDTTTGHWEIAGIVSEQPMPVYPDGFPMEILQKLEKKTGRGILCNKPYSGTDVIRDYGSEHMETGKLIVYTSADSVLQIAAHEDVVPLAELYQDCKIAREIMKGDHCVGRVIARPFTGEPGNFVRTPHRHDYSLLPPSPTIMDVLCEHGYDTIGVGKIYDIFAGRNIDRTVSIVDNVDGMNKTMEFQKEDFRGLCFVNLVDFDMEYGHRNDVDGYAGAASVFDKQLGSFMGHMKEGDILFITADHGCDPGYPGTDHTRECTPVLVYGKGIVPGKSVGTRESFADIGATILEMFKIKGDIDGKSFLPEIITE